MGVYRCTSINYWHFSDNSQALNTDICQNVRKNSQTMYTMDPEIVIDETMVPWREILFKQYIPEKKT